MSLKRPGLHTPLAEMAQEVARMFQYYLVMSLDGYLDQDQRAS